MSGVNAQECVSGSQSLTDAAFEASALMPVCTCTGMGAGLSKKYYIARDITKCILGCVQAATVLKMRQFTGCSSSLGAAVHKLQ